MTIRLSRLNWNSQQLVEELLENREYFADIENAFVEGGPFTGESLEKVIEELGTSFYHREVELAEVEWAKAAEYLNGKLG